jgi:Putative transposase/Transposase zinc-binding domain
VERPAFEVADIFRRHGAVYRANHRLPLEQHRLMRAIEICRTAALGGHVERCGHCPYQRISYNSCRNRHCPKCQNLERGKWLARRKAELLPVEYYHVVFTIPEQLNRLALANKETVYKILFQTSAETLQTIARDPKHLGAEIGFFSILHTWGQNLLHHPHVHCVVTGGGLSPDRKTWIGCRPGFFLSVRVLWCLFRRLFLDALRQALNQKQLQFPGQLQHQEALLPRLLDQLSKIKWVVYAKAPFGGANQVLEYLGRYTHRVALSNDRLLNVEGEQVTFQYKDYRSRDRHKSRSMTVTAEEFIRRFLLHAIPSGFQRIRHYGLLASRNKKQTLALCRQLLGIECELLPTRAEMDNYQQRVLIAVRLCPQCGTGWMIRMQTIPACRWPNRPPDTS